ncbi:MAG: response regulator [Myxococcota bacterium]|nr:response regulator [Myxococcota bacterium]
MTNHSTQRLRVLIVDDEFEIRELLGEYLSARGHEVYTASDGQQALSWLERNTADVLLTDVQMPTVTGVELVTALHRKSVRIGVVVMTGFPTVEIVTAAMKMGVSDYLLKPFRLRDVYSAVMRAAAGGQAEHELARLKLRTALVEALLLAAAADRAAILQAQLPGLLASEIAMRQCALWLRQGDDFTPVIPARGVLAAVKPEEAALSRLEAHGATIRLPGGAGVLAIECTIDAAGLERMEHIVRILTAAMGR